MGDEPNKICDHVFAVRELIFLIRWQLAASLWCNGGWKGAPREKAGVDTQREFLSAVIDCTVSVLAVPSPMRELRSSSGVKARWTV